MKDQKDLMRSKIADLEKQLDEMCASLDIIRPHHDKVQNVTVYARPITVSRLKGAYMMGLMERVGDLDEAISTYLDKLEAQNGPIKPVDPHLRMSRGMKKTEHNSVRETIFFINKFARGIKKLKESYLD